MAISGAVYLVVRLALAVFTCVMAGVTFQYAVDARRDGRRWKVGTVGGFILVAAASLSILEAIDQVIEMSSQPMPLTKWWLFGFDFLVPMYALQLVRAWRERDRAEMALGRLATTDPLTGVLNRRGFIGQAVAAIAAARRSGEDVALILFDIDHFKAINDDHGHQVGNAVLTALAGAVASGLRSDGVFARVGGEEFALLLPGAKLEQGLAAAQRVRASIRGALLPAGIAAVTASAGVATVADTGEPEAALNAALATADACLYDAKRGGRDRVVIMQMVMPSLVPH